MDPNIRQLQPLRWHPRLHQKLEGAVIVHGVIARLAGLKQQCSTGMFLKFTSCRAGSACTVQFASPAASLATSAVCKGAVVFVGAGEYVSGMSVSPYGRVAPDENTASMKGGPVGSMLTMAFTKLGLTSAITHGISPP